MVLTARKFRGFFGGSGGGALQENFCKFRVIFADFLTKKCRLGLSQNIILKQVHVNKTPSFNKQEKILITDTDTNTKKLEDGYGYGYKKI